MQIKKQFHETVKVQTRQYKALQRQMVSTMPKEKHREVLRQKKEEQMRKMALLATQYERTIADMLQQQTVCCGGCGSDHMILMQLQVKLDEAQEKEQDALKTQLKQEEELLKEYQIKQESRLVEQLKREKITLEERIEASKRHLEKEVSGWGYPCIL